jgi:hypothetical protein
MIAIKLCANKYDDWCDIVESNVYIGASLEATQPIGALIACIILYLVSLCVWYWEDIYGMLRNPPPSHFLSFFSSFNASIYRLEEIE